MSLTISASIHHSFVDQVAPRPEPKSPTLLQRIGQIFRHCIDWLVRNRHTILLVSGIALGVTCLFSAEALAFLPLAVLNVALGTLGLIRKSIANKILQCGQKELKELQKEVEAFKVKMPSTAQSLNSAEEVEKFAQAIVTVPKDQKSLFTGSFKRIVSREEAILQDYKTRLEGLKKKTQAQDEIKELVAHYRDYAFQVRTRLIYEADENLKKGEEIVKYLQKRAERA
jgi:hypothetical protein